MSESLGGECWWVSEEISYGKPSPGPLKQRTKLFALNVIRFYAGVPRSPEAQIIGKQLLRSATSVGAHYREGTRARSAAEFISKLEVGVQELEESIYWLELLSESGIFRPNDLAEIATEADELTAMLISSIRTVKARNSKP